MCLQTSALPQTFAGGMQAGSLGEQDTRDQHLVGEGSQESLLLRPYSALDTLRKALDLCDLL